METTITPHPSPDPASPDTPVWVPSQFKPESELSDYARDRRRKRSARLSDDYAGRPFTLGETIANSVSQGVAALMSLVALIILVVVAVSNGAGLRLFAALVFAIALVAGAAASALSAHKLSRPIDGIVDMRSEMILPDFLDKTTFLHRAHRQAIAYLDAQESHNMFFLLQLQVLS